MLDKIQQDLNEALKAGDKFKVETLRMVVSNLKTSQIDARRDLSDDEIIKLLQKESKRRSEAAEMYEKGGASDRAQKEIQEKQLIETYLPEQMSDEQIEQIIKSVVNEVNPAGLADMGKIIGLVKEKTGAQAEGSKIAALVKRNLSQ